MLKWLGRLFTFLLLLTVIHRFSQTVFHMKLLLFFHSTTIVFQIFCDCLFRYLIVCAIQLNNSHIINVIITLLNMTNIAWPFIGSGPRAENVKTVFKWIIYSSSNWSIFRVIGPYLEPLSYISNNRFMNWVELWNKFGHESSRPMTRFKP